MLRITYLKLAILFLPIVTWAQITVYPLERNISATNKNHLQGGRVKVVEPVSIPFWDDFSFSTGGMPIDTMWVNNASVLVNDGQAIDPPSVNVATFDGLDQNGVPYSPAPTDHLQYGYRDTLESQPIKMSEIDVADRNGVYLSFYFQAGGHGDPPDPNDFLRLEFKNDDDVWESIVLLRNDNAPDPTLFYDTLIQIDDARFFHDEFRFRFISFGRKSGRYDAWHVDYVYLNKGRNPDDRSRPDRAITSRLTSLFDGYYGIPKAHLDSSRIITAPRFKAYNLKIGPPQPTNYRIDGTFRQYHDGVETVNTMQIGTESGINGGGDAAFNSLERKDVALFYLPDADDPTQFDYTADSIKVKLEIRLFADDVFDVETGEYSEDYDPAVYAPIDFRLNDTISQSYIIKDFYAYDDGSADYAGGLVDPGNQLAYKFEMKVTGQDTLNGLYIYFPYFAGPVASTVDFFIMNHAGGQPGSILYEQTVSVTRTANNKFTFVELDQGVIVEDIFFIGYREPFSGSLRIGLDKSHDTGGNMYFRLSENGNWQVNDRVTGSFMIRPRIGHGDIITGLPEEEKNPVSFYPNPSRGSFTVKGQFEQLHITTLTGQPVSFEMEDLVDEKRIHMEGASTGLYIARYRSGSRVFTEKIVVRK